MEKKGTPASAGVDPKLGAVASGSGETIIVGAGSRDKRFGPQERLGKDKCGY